MKPNYYAIIPANVRYDSTLIANAKLLYGEISAMCGVEGYCWAENSYFANLYDVSSFTISRWISKLETNGHIKTVLDKKKGNFRQIFIDKTAVDLLTKSARPIDEKRKRVLTKSARPIDEKRKSIYENITINNTMNKKEENALAYLIKNSLSEWENFQMRFKKNFKSEEWEKFQELFDCKFNEEGREFSVKTISSRLTRFAINYCENLKKAENKEKGSFPIEVSVNHPSRKKIA